MIFDWDDSTVVSPVVVIDWETDVFFYVIPEFELFYLHAGMTSMLYHAEGTTGESTPITVLENLVDESSNQITDGLGNNIVIATSENAILLHAKETDTLYHAEA